jgi:hypothetical protein
MHYEHGSIFWKPDTGAFAVHRFVVRHWTALGREAGRAGYPVQDDAATADGTGRFSEFERGAIYWTPTTGAHFLPREILAKWRSLGAEAGFLGYPVDEERVTPDGRGRHVTFQNSTIWRTLEWGAYEVHGLIAGKWAELGLEQGWLGFPVSDELALPDGSGRYNVFEHGVVKWSWGAPGAVATAHEYERIYSQIRAPMLSRFFALGNRGRRNQFSMSNRLAVDPDGPVGEADRWGIVQSNCENPFLLGSLLYAMLGVEHRLGNEESTRAINAGLATLESLFVWKHLDSNESRLPIRWDPGIPTDQRDEAEQFLTVADGSYSLGLPPADLNHLPERDGATLEALMGVDEATRYRENLEDSWRFRNWELSMDEVVGLATTLWLLKTLGRDGDMMADG